MPYAGTTEIGDLGSACNLNCGCSDTTFNPVCGDDGITYYSSCYAGFQEFINDTVS